MFHCNCSREHDNETNCQEVKKTCQNGSCSCSLCDRNPQVRHINDPLQQVTIRMSDDADQYKSQCTNLSSNQQEQQQNNKEQRNNDPLLQCNNCHEHIQFSVYSGHLSKCNGRRGCRTGNHTQSTTDSTSESKEATTIRAECNKESHVELTNTVENVGEQLCFKSDKERLNTSTPGEFINKENPNEILERKVKDVKNDLTGTYYLNEVDHATRELQFNILISGSPRIGKSELINSLCGGESLAETSASLNSCTKKVKCYVLKDKREQTSDVHPFRVNFYDTPGIESWGEGEGEGYMKALINQIDPICFIFCASPGSFAKLEQLEPVLRHCHKEGIFCALVCTNMWSNPNRDVVLEEFQDRIAFFGEKRIKSFEQDHDLSHHQVIHFGNGALCTMVNSKGYSNPSLSSVIKPVQGVDELIHCIMEQLDHEKLLGWCHAVLYRRTYWEKIQHNVAGFALLRLNNLEMNNWNTILQRFLTIVIHDFPSWHWK